MSKVAERKIINEKIAKVREVVHGVSTNDIILALYSLDMNVERTIQAFCEDGASEVLDDWVRPASGSSKNKNKKKKNKQHAVPEPTAAPVETATTAPSTASASKTAKAAPPAKGM
ncbi:hypothetical protein TELCIR_22014 [Teladorsagia circumcincta]|uniref:CUE domain-containing protein n=1 Tax=Teladorsagia circumcincta TaxID=45464 RepID=A0A2G9TF38_TELCI|nr:hypothetical protein TELCIR_22014 [Teladorsagia circumcincta]